MNSFLSIPKPSGAGRELELTWRLQVGPLPAIVLAAREPQSVALCEVTKVLDAAPEVRKDGSYQLTRLLWGFVDKRDSIGFTHPSEHFPLEAMETCLGSRFEPLALTLELSTVEATFAAMELNIRRRGRKLGYKHKELAYMGDCQEIANRRKVVKL